MIINGVDNFGELSFRNLDPERDDLSNYLSWMKNVEENAYIESVSAQWTMEKLQSFINEINESKLDLLLGIFVKNSNVHIGNIKFANVFLDSNSCSVGILIGRKEFRGKGVASTTLRFLTYTLFRKFRIREFYLGVNSQNLPAIKSYIKAGFKIDHPTPDGRGFKMSYVIKDFTFD